jgi:hypothetical protein
MIGNSHFYYRSINKLVVSFGNLFNDIDIVRFTKDGTPKEKFKVPLSYAQKEKYITRITSDANLTKSVMTVVPRMSFVIDTIAYDETRKQITTLKNYNKTSSTNIDSQYVPVPYNFGFNVSLFTRNIEDATQVLEQILPFFTPDYTMTIDFMNSIGRTYDVPVILNSVTSSTEYEGTMDNTRIITWELEFTAKSYIWPPINDAGIIKQIDVNLRNYENSNTIVNIDITPNPSDAKPEDNYGYTTVITEYND